MEEIFQITGVVAIGTISGTQLPNVVISFIENNDNKIEIFDSYYNFYFLNISTKIVE